MAQCRLQSPASCLLLRSADWCASGLAHGLHVLGLATATTLLRNVASRGWGCRAEHVVATVGRVRHAHAEWGNWSSWLVTLLGERSETVVARLCCARKRAKVDFHEIVLSDVHFV